MSNWLQKLIGPTSTVKINLPTKLQQGVPPSVLSNLGKLELTKGLPPAAIVYGIAAGAFFAFALYLLVQRHWIDGILTMLPAAGFVGFAVHMIKHGQAK